MQCPECGGDVPPLREVCPKCGAPTAWGLRKGGAGSPGGRPGHQLNRNRNRVLLIGAGILASALVLGQGNWFDFDSSDGNDRPRGRGPVTIEAQQLYEAYRDDERGADRRFDGREMVVSGEFLRIVPDGYGSLDLRLKTSNPDEPLGIDVTQVELDAAKQLRPGERVTVSCQRMGSGGDELWVQDCAIQSVEKGNASPNAMPVGEPPVAPTPPPANEENSG